MTAAAVAASAPSPVEIAKQAVAPSPASSSTAAYTPSLASILNAFQKDGNNDTELLKIILKAKEKEDEVSYMLYNPFVDARSLHRERRKLTSRSLAWPWQRLAADAMLKVEQLKVQHTLVLSQVYYAQVQAQAQSFAGYAPYSPTSPPSENGQVSPYPSQQPGPNSHLHPCPPMNGHPGFQDRRGSSYSPPPPGQQAFGMNAETAKRARASSSVSNSSTRSTTSTVFSLKEEDGVPSAKKARKSGPLAPVAPLGKPSHEDVMAALRYKCERNQAQAGAPTPVFTAGGWSSMHKPAAAAGSKRPLAPRPSPPPATTSNMPPPAARMTSKSPPLRNSPPLRHSGFFSPRPVPTTGAESTKPTSPSAGEVTRSRTSPTPPGGLQMLLNAGAAVEAEHPVSDVRGA